MAFNALIWDLRLPDDGLRRTKMKRITRHHERIATLDQVDELVKRLKAAREE